MRLYISKDQLSALSRQLSGFRAACGLSGCQAVGLSSYQAVRPCVMGLATTVPRRKAPRKAL